jgi:beta-glucosidase
MAAIRASAPTVPAGIVLNFEPHVPASDHPLDLEAASLVHGRYNRWFIDPLTGGDYPEDVVNATGWRREEVQAGDMATIAAQLDFMGVNSTPQLRALALLPTLEPRRDREVTGGGWEVHPVGLTHILEFVASRTGDLPLYVDENGAAYPDDPTDPAHDPERVEYLRRHFAAVQGHRHGVPVRGFFVWSLMDNFEWAEGYANRFGLIHVDFATQERRIRDSGRFVAELARAGRLEEVAR